MSKWFIQQSSQGKKDVVAIVTEKEEICYVLYEQTPKIYALLNYQNQPIATYQKENSWNQSVALPQYLIQVGGYQDIQLKTILNHYHMSATIVGEQLDIIGNAAKGDFEIIKAKHTIARIQRTKREFYVQVVDEQYESLVAAILVILYLHFNC